MGGVWHHGEYDHSVSDPKVRMRMKKVNQRLTSFPVNQIIEYTT